MTSAARDSVLLALVDDHPIVRSALKTALFALGPGTRFVEAVDAPSALALIERESDIDLLLIDLNMPGAAGTDAIRSIRESAPQLPVAVLSASEDTGIMMELLQMGVCGFIPKSDSADVIVNAVRLLLAGGTYVPLSVVRGPAHHLPGGTAMPGPDRGALTPRQVEVLRLLGRGMSNKHIARELRITEGTVKVHLLAVFRVLNVRNRTAAVIAARDHCA